MTQATRREEEEKKEEQRENKLLFVGERERKENVMLKSNIPVLSQDITPALLT